MKRLATCLYLALLQGQLAFAQGDTIIDNAESADYAELAGESTTAGLAQEAVHAVTADSATSVENARSADTAQEAIQATNADTASTLTDSLCSDQQIIRKDNNTWRCTDTAPKSESADAALTADQAAVAETADSMTPLLCSSGALLLKIGGGWICTETATHALTADIAETADILSGTLCIDGQILVKENGLWLCGNTKQKDKTKANKSKEADHAIEADHTLVADSFSPETCGNGEILLKINGEWQCSIAAPGIPLSTSGLALWGPGGGAPILYSTPNDSNSCCFTEEEKHLSNVVLPRGGVLSRLIVTPRLMPAKNTQLVIDVLVNGAPKLTVVHTQNTFGDGPAVNFTDQQTVMPGDQINVRFLEIGGRCGLEAANIPQDLDFLSSIQSLKDTIWGILPLVIPYNSGKGDPDAWADPVEQEDSVDLLREDFYHLEAGLQPYVSCGSYDVSFMLE